MTTSLSLIIIVCGSVITLALGFILKRFRLWGRPWQRALLLIIGLAGWYLVVDGSAEVTESLAKQNWPQVSGLVIRSEVIGTGAYRPNIVYQYSVDNQSLTDSSALSPPSFGGRNARRKAAATIVARYVVGDTILIYYNPDRPAESLLSLHPFWAVYMKIGLGLLLFIAGFAFLLAGLWPISHKLTPAE